MTDDISDKESHQMSGWMLPPTPDVAAPGVKSDTTVPGLHAKRYKLPPNVPPYDPWLGN